MKLRDFIATSSMASLALGTNPQSLIDPDMTQNPQRISRQIVIAGGGFRTSFIRYMAELSGKERPRMCYLPTASADNEGGILRWYESCAPLDVTPLVQKSFVNSYDMKESWRERFLSMDGIVVSGGNTLNQQAIWKAQGIDEVLREAWDNGVILGGASAGSLCWFESGTTDSRPQELSEVQCLGFLSGSHSPHYDGEEQRRPTYHRLIRSGVLKPGYACDNDAGIHFVDNEVHRVIKTREEAQVYFVDLVDGEVVETELPGEMID